MYIVGDKGNLKPNILIIQTDQQSSWTLGCYGGSLIGTPNIDFLAGEGARLVNFFTPSAVCTPSRGCFITGRYPHCNGAYRNDAPLGKNETTIAHILKGNGYKTGYAGKWHLNGSESPGWIDPRDSMGFDDCRYMFNSGHYKKVVDVEDGKPEVSKEIGDEKTYMTDWLADKTIDFIKSRSNAPFFFMLSIPDPHQPYNVRAPYDTMFKPSEMPVPESFYQVELPDWADQDEWGRKRYFPVGMENREQKLREIKARYCGEVKCIDDNVGKIIHCLKEQGIFENTMIVFTTDHGEYMGEHGMLEKNNLYDAVYHIPLILCWPEKIKKGTVVEKFVSTVDFQQTLLGLVGLSPCGKEQGRDASLLIMGEDAPWEDEVFIHPSDVPRAGIITPEYELAYVGRGWNREEGHEFKDHILFDRVKDPGMMNNLFDCTEYREVVNLLTGRMVNHFRKLGIDKEVLPKILKEKL